MLGLREPQPNQMKLTIRKPDDMHVHLRDGLQLASVLQYTASRFARAVVMPNLDPPITTTKMALQYRARILQELPSDLQFNPLMTLYLTEETTYEEISRAKDSGIIIGVKYYPAGATTNSNLGVTNIEKVYHIFAELEKHSMPLLVHGEVVDQHVDVFDRERIFIDEVLQKIMYRFPALKLVLEHITTQEAVQAVWDGPPTLAATITVHHLLLNRNALFQGGIQPHHYCLPLVKTEDDRLALVEAAVSDNPKFFLGTDSAPHARKTKERACGCAGIFTAYAALELYAEVFEKEERLYRLNDFASVRGAEFYGLPKTDETITLYKTPQTIPNQLLFGSDDLVPFHAGRTCSWSLVSG